MYRALVHPIQELKEVIGEARDFCAGLEGDEAKWTAIASGVGGVALLQVETPSKIVNLGSKVAGSALIGFAGLAAKRAMSEHAQYFADAYAEAIYEGPKTLSR